MNAKQEILDRLGEVERAVKKSSTTKIDYVSILEYEEFVRTNGEGVRVWTDALQRAIDENEAVYIPASLRAYYIDGTITIPSHRIIRADRHARICQTKGTRVLILRNRHTVDGTHAMPSGVDRDSDITIIGGIFEESYRCRLGYGKSGMYDENRSYYGVSTCMLFNNIDGLYLRDVTFRHTAGFAVQVGEICGAVFENITFKSCYADGLHINGNTENVVIRNIRGKVGDDLVALNMYDWQDSSVNFGPMKNVLVENLHLSMGSPYKAMRIEPGRYYFDDGTSVDCSVENLIVRGVRGINTFKMYFQTPAYKIGEEPEKGGVGSGDNVYFEDIVVNLRAPIDYLAPYVYADPVRGNFGAFELGANIENVHFENIHAKINSKKYPMAGLISVGPKSCMNEGIEVFDPYLSSMIGNIHFRNIIINGKPVDDLEPYVRISKFDNINDDNNSTAHGEVCGYIAE